MRPARSRALQAGETREPHVWYARPAHARERSMLEYFTIATIATLLTHAYFTARFVPPLRDRPRARTIVIALLAADILLLPGTLVATLQSPARFAAWSVPVAHLAFAMVGFCITLAFVLAVRDIAWVIALAIARWRRGGIENAERRTAIVNSLNLAATGVAAIATGTGYALALANPRVERVRIGLPGMRSARALRVVQVSDLHVGPTIRRDYVASLVDAVNALDPDVIALTGDLVDGTVAQLAEQVAPLARLRARHGVFVVTGNHEYFYDAEAWTAHFASWGHRVLGDRADVITHDDDSIALVGVHDEMSTPRALDRDRVIATALASAPAHDASILLAHRPSDAPHAARHGLGAQLSGHIHDGQFVPLAWLVRRVEPYVAGFYRVGSMGLYVNRGAGYWGPPNRLGTRQEITLVEFVRAPREDSPMLRA